MLHRLISDKPRPPSFTLQPLVFDPLEDQLPPFPEATVSTTPVTVSSKSGQSAVTHIDGFENLSEPSEPGIPSANGSSHVALISCFGFPLQLDLGMHHARGTS